jgi:hypothetical protein
MGTSSQNEPVYDAQCIVCLKEVREGDELCHIKIGDRFVTVCCPLCFEALETDPESYVGRKLPPRKNNPSIPGLS